MPWSAPKHCPNGHPPYTGKSCPLCRPAQRAAADKRRPSARERGYTSKWQAARAAFLAVHRYCVRCSAPATVVDHIVPHRGDDRLFWDRANWQPMCASCHSSAKQSEERSLSQLSQVCRSGDEPVNTLKENMK